MPPRQGTGLQLRREHVVNASLVGAVVVVVGFASGLGVQQVPNGGQPALAEHSPHTGQSTPPSKRQPTAHIGHSDPSMSVMANDYGSDAASNPNSWRHGAGWETGGSGMSGHSHPGARPGQPGTAAPSPGSPQPSTPPCDQGMVSPVLDLVSATADGVLGTVGGIAGPVAQNLGAPLPLPLGAPVGAPPLAGTTGAPGVPGQGGAAGANIQPCPVAVPALPSPAPSQPGPTPAGAPPSVGVPVSVLGGGK